jgi:hypothetical protein
MNAIAKSPDHQIAKSAIGNRQSAIDNSPFRIPSDGPVFWSLFILGIGTLAPCVLMPEWRRYEELYVAEQTARHQVDLLTRAVEDESRRAEALRSDPMVIVRLAQRDLGLVRADEEPVPVAVAPVSRTAEDPFTPQPPPPPELVKTLASRLPDYDYAGLFTERSSRTPLLVMSISLLVVTFLLFTRSAPQTGSPCTARASRPTAESYCPRFHWPDANRPG